MRIHANIAWAKALIGCLLVAASVPARAGIEAGVPLVQPWRRVALDPEYAGAWVVAGDLDGDGWADVLLTTHDSAAVSIYKNEHGRKPDPPARPGTEPNFTLY